MKHYSIELDSLVKLIQESDEELRKLERATKSAPDDRGAWKRLNAAKRRAGEKPVNAPRSPADLRSAANKADKRVRTAPLQIKHTDTARDINRVFPTRSQASYRAAELTGRADGDKRMAVAAGRARKLYRTLAKHAKKLPKGRDDQFTHTDQRYRRLEYLAGRGADQVSDIRANEKLGTNFKKTQDPERVSLVRLSSRSRRQHHFPSWKDNQQTEAEDNMRHECAWCGKHTGGPADSKVISHGICKPCFDKVKAEIPTKNVVPKPPELPGTPGVPKI